ncbi:MAG: hypothetical protein JEY96_15765 [Bacteroidales bacterium]|nr:hypothetical protein [Bacteroidales bacterium]
MAKNNEYCIFISAKRKENVDKFKELLYDKVKEIHAVRYSHNNYLYELTLSAWCRA